MPLILKHGQPLVGVWKIDESEEELLALLGGTERYLPFLEKISSRSRRLEWLAVRALIRNLLGRESFVAYRESGAPYLPDIDLHISISHTKGYAAVALSELSPAGIDIEYLSDRVLKVRKRFMSAEEEAFIEPDSELEHSLVCWCAKEAIYKRTGKSDTDFRQDIQLAPFNYGESGSITARSYNEPLRLNYLVSKYFVLAWLLDSSVVG